MSKRDIINELFKSARKNFLRRRVIIKGMDDLWQGDLVEMIPFAKFNNNYRYLLTVIDSFSKKAWAIPVKNKTAEDVTKATNTILANNEKRIPKNFQSDKGKEFYNQQFTELMKKHGINHYSTYSNLKASIVERFNRTLKNLMYKEFHVQGNYKWIHIIDNLLDKYNNTIHSKIKLKPNQVNKKNEKKILKSVYNRMKIINVPKFVQGDMVRISKNRGIFDKGYLPSWTTEIFKIRKVKLTIPITYLLTDLSGDNILGSFYEQELQKTKYPNIYLVEKVIKRRGNDLYVKWLGFDNSHNSWIKQNELV